MSAPGLRFFRIFTGRSIKPDCHPASKPASQPTSKAAGQPASQNNSQADCVVFSLLLRIVGVPLVSSLCAFFKVLVRQYEKT